MAASDHAWPPAVDEGDPPGVASALLRSLAPAPGRLGNTLRLVVLVLLCVSLSEAFRLPEAALSAYVALFVSRGEAASTVMTAAIAGIAVLLALLATIGMFTLSLAEPALRIPLVAATTFIAMFLSRTSSLGAAFFAAGFIVAYGMTLGDEVLQLSLMPGSVANTPEFTLPELAFIPPEEGLVRFLLWLGLAVAMPVALVIAANLLTGRRPGALLRAGLAERLVAAARFCAGEPGAAAALRALAREGTAELAKLQHLSGVLRSRRHPLLDASLVRDVGRLSLVLLAFARLDDGRAPRANLEPAGRLCLKAVRKLRGDRTTGEASAIDEAAMVDSASAAETPLILALLTILRDIEGALAAPRDRTVTPKKRPPHRLLVGDAFSNPTYPRFAFKVTLAVMLCYLGETLADWPGIHTCIITCFFVSLDTVGETVHKAALRIVGCLLGAALGIGTIIVLMPVMTDLGDLLAALAIVTLLAGWIATGSERISYAGWQMALAFYLTTLQGFGPTLDMQTARDRIVGIIVGNLVVFAVFTTIWPVRVAVSVRAGLANAVEQLAQLVDAGRAASKPASTFDLEQTFEQAIAGARSLVVNDRFERPSSPAANVIDADLLTRVQALGVPVLVLAGVHADPAWTKVAAPAQDAAAAYQRALADWLRDCASWVRRGGAPDLAASLPPVPSPDPVGAPPPPNDPGDALLAAQHVWVRLLDGDVRAILARIGPHRSNAVPFGEGAGLALSSP